MYIGYVDESGYVGRTRNESQPIQTVACVLPSAYNLHRTYDDFGAIMQVLRENDIALEELKAEEIYRGRGAWERVDGEIRHNIFDTYFSWLVDRKHKLILNVIDNNKFFNLKDSGDQIATILNSPYVSGALHIALSIQKHNQRRKRNKGKTILIFDEQEEFRNKVGELIARPPEFTDIFYGYKNRDGIRFNQIIDTAYFVKSHYSYIIQIADTIAFVSRLYFQITAYEMPEAYNGELNRIKTWWYKIKTRLIPNRDCYPSKSNLICNFYKRIAPSNFPI